jgi:hypothetical protein
MTKIQIYREECGGWSFDAAEGRQVEADLSDGHRRHLPSRARPRDNFRA